MQQEKNNKTLSQLSFAEILEKKGEKITDKPRYLYELAAYYSIGRVTFRRWLDCPQLRHIAKSKDYRYLYTISEIKQIVEHLDEP